LLADIDRKHKSQLDEVRQELAVLKGQLAELRVEAKLRGSLDDMEARLLRMEARPTSARLKSITGWKRRTACSYVGCGCRTQKNAQGGMRVLAGAVEWYSAVASAAAKFANC
jgi:ribosomal protein L29